MAVPNINELAQKCLSNGMIDQKYYQQYDVKRGLRDVNGEGVLTGLTEISDIIWFKRNKDGSRVLCDGELYFRGYNVRELVDGFMSENRFGFEETVWLLLFGSLPTSSELDAFNDLLSEYRTLPTNFVRDVILKAPSKDMMNALSKCVLTLYAYDEKANELTVENVLRQCLQLIATFPLLGVYAYQSYSHYHENKSLIIHPPVKGLSTAENILHMLRPDSSYTPLEAKILDIALVLHAEHGGGNNSTFTTHVVTSSGTDTYSTVAASLGSLKGSRHGGANLKAAAMMEDMKKQVSDHRDDDMIRDYIRKLLRREAFDKMGLVYGIGHAVYSISDPRAEILKGMLGKLSAEKGRSEEYEFFEKVASIAPSVLAEERKIYKDVGANVDFYSGLMYSLLDIPVELYTAIFAMSRIAGWSAHRIEELMNAGKIIRPAYEFVGTREKYTALSER